MKWISMVLNKKKYSNILFIIWMISILYMNIDPKFGDTDLPLEQDKMNLRVDYFMHFIMFFVTSLFLCIIPLYYINNKYYLKKNRFLLLFFIGLLMACSIETLQIIVPGRTFNYIDMIFNISGLLLGVSVFFIGFMDKICQS